MVSKEEWNSIKNPVIRINKDLDKYNEKPVFQKKLKLAMEMLAKYPLPKEIYDFEMITK
ncbi:MAG: hypothetical protein FWH18_11990 [Marinilabiliaceae bacterium]|nr:hypothetical protein [Marinilabiliaceae bacterium]